jgi:tripartite-type tricarboxylate transporter receptor subunit TctC
MLAAVIGTTAAWGQGRVTRILVAFPPGGPVDLVARTIADQLGRELKQQVIVENKPGGNGAVAAQAVIQSVTDGTTLWLTSVGAAAINPVLYDKLDYDMQRDFAPVSLVVNNVELLVVNANNPAANAADFVAAVKKGREHPAAMASSGVGSIPHLAIEQLTDATGARLLHVPYKGAAPAITDLMGGQVDGFFGDVPGLIGHVKAGKVKALGIASPKRHPALPEVRTLEEQGIKGVDTVNWYALFVSAKTPPAVVAQLNKAVQATLNTPVVRERLLQQGAEPAPSTPQELSALLKHDTDKWARLIKAKNIKAE